MMIDTKTQNAKPPARLHAILARRGANAVVFRRGPSDKVAVVGWDRSNDTFTLGQWLRGRIYPLRCDLSPSGKHLIYFAAKYGRENPVEKLVREELKKRFKTVDLWRVDHRLLAQAEDELRRKKEFQKLEKSGDYHDCSWTAISRSPYLKALSIWWNGTGWNGGGLFESEGEYYLNRPPERIARTIPGVQERRFKELEPTSELVQEFGWGHHGECWMVYGRRLIRDGWREVDYENGFAFEKELQNGWILRKECPADDYSPLHEVYWERHLLLDADGKTLIKGKDWRWAEYDDYRKRIVYAENGAIYALGQKLPLKPILLYDFNEMTFKRISAPY